MKKIISMLILCFLVTGCNYQELNEISIASTLTIEKKNNKFIVNALIINPGEEENKIYVGDGDTVYYAIHQLENKMDKKIYLNHLSSIIIDEEVLKNDFKTIIQFFLNKKNINKNFYVLLSNDSGKEILGKASKNYQNNTYQLPVVGNNKNNDFIESSFQTIASKMLSIGVDPIIAKIKIEGDDIQLDGSVAINFENKLYNLDNDTTKIISLIKKSDRHFLYIDKIEGCLINYDITSKKISNSYKNNTVKNNLDFSAKIEEISCGKTIETPELEKNLEKSLSSKIESEMEKLVKNKVDAFGFGLYIFRNYNKEWSPDYLNKMKVDTSIKVRVERDKKDLRGIYAKKIFD